MIHIQTIFICKQLVSALLLAYKDAENHYTASSLGDRYVVNVSGCQSLIWCCTCMSNLSGATAVASSTHVMTVLTQQGSICILYVLYII